MNKTQTPSLSYLYCCTAGPRWKAPTALTRGGGASSEEAGYCKVSPARIPLMVAAVASMCSIPLCSAPCSV